MKRSLFVAAAATPLLILGLAACSSDNTDTTTTTPPAPASSSAAPSSSEPAPASTEASPSTDASASGSTAAAGLTLADVAMHATEKDCWAAINGNVYDFTAWIPTHPGGAAVVIAMCGTDGTASYMGQHTGNAEADAALVSYQIGVLADAAASTNASASTGASTGAAALPTGVTANPDTNPAAVTVANTIIDTKMTLADAEKAVKDAGFESRVIFNNGEGQAATNDYRPDRFNLVVEGPTGSEVVVGVTFG